MKGNICSRCVLDTTVKDLVFNDEGICNYCGEYDRLASKTVLMPREQRYKQFDEVVATIKSGGAGFVFVCVLGLSGGVVSSYLALVAHQNGLRPLVVHFDNGWNNELAVKNIENIVSSLNFDLHTYVINWQEFKDLQLAYFRASVLDIEVPTDQLIVATLYKIAKENSIKYILSGNNFRTEFMLPESWCLRRKLDRTNLTNIHKAYGEVRLKKFPKIGVKELYRYKRQGIRLVTFFDKIDFNLIEVKKMLKKELNWNDYAGKHFESIFTRFYQGYILPKKFNIDKRKAHLSSLICSKQMTREEALEELNKPTYDEEVQKQDKEYVLKKWGISEDEFEEVMRKPVVSHDEFGYDKTPVSIRLMNKLRLIYLFKFAYPLGIKKK